MSNNLWTEIRECSRTVETQMNSLERKRTGSYYTSLDLTDAMMEELVSKMLTDKVDVANLKFLEPCVGTGNFVFSYLKQVKKLGLSKADYKKIVNNIYVADINVVALRQYQELFSKYVYETFGIILNDEYFLNHIGGGLLVDVTNVGKGIVKIEDVFPKEVIGEGFDVVVTNPPYKNLKAERNQYENEEDYILDKERYTSISKTISRYLHYSTDGVLNLYKLFVEEIIERYSSDNAYIDLLIPATILSDKTCANIRTHILKNANLLSVKAIREGSGYIDAQQALAVVFIKKGEKTREVEVTKDFFEHPEQKVSVSINDILNDNTGNAIFTLNEQEYHLLKKLRNFPTVGELSFIHNLRGELDLTANRESITANQTPYKLLRGRNIGYYRLLPTVPQEYVSEDFLQKTAKRDFIKAERIICQQVVNMHKDRRVTYALVEPDFVLGNSCNFIAVDDNDAGIDIYSLMGLFNSSIINWFFKLTSSNNHVNNYEIACFPVPVNNPLLKQISKKVREYLKKGDELILKQIENLTNEAYGITDNMAEKGNPKKQELIDTDVSVAYYQDIRHVMKEITPKETADILHGNASLSAVMLQHRTCYDKFGTNVIKGITEKYRKLNAHEVLNHTTFKLSDLDLEMIKSVPQGGSWKDIPMETVNKSKRLKRITETGGRTTLYGRIDYKKPSYTITTYFNRPGNGTYVHPVHERVLSVREAARFQTFRDDYYFFGNKTQMLKQVGNAVPTILAYQIADKIRKVTGCEKSIDLFCGAGGMTAGFRAAGIKSQLSTDIEESACTTLKINCPEINTFVGDITLKETKDYIVDVAENTGADIICGGPPCQGFSLAGFRLTDDPRNQLFKDYVDIVRRVSPKVIVFENVEGLLSFQNGNVYKAILEMFGECGYETEGRVLMANNYAVPQKRKRVIIICTRKDQNFHPCDLFPDAITTKEENQITAFNTNKDLENVECGENAVYDAEAIESEIVKFFKGKISYAQYLYNISKDSQK